MLGSLLANNKLWMPSMEGMVPTSPAASSARRRAGSVVTDREAVELLPSAREKSLKQGAQSAARGIRKEFQRNFHFII